VHVYECMCVWECVCVCVFCTCVVSVFVGICGLGGWMGVEKELIIMHACGYVRVCVVYVRT